ncbi:MAG: response regulator [Desulfobacterales bacterium]|nr:response regulator [Desulfobacterales bacterium]
MARILIADDSFLQRRMLGNVIKDEGHEVIEAVNGKDALEKAGAESPDCMLLDLLMPEIDGFGVLDGLREKGLKIPVIIFSADIQDTTRAKCYEMGVAAFLNKPINDEVLRKTVRNVLTSHGE